MMFVLLFCVWCRCQREKFPPHTSFYFSGSAFLLLSYHRGHRRSGKGSKGGGFESSLNRLKKVSIRSVSVCSAVLSREVVAVQKISSKVRTLLFGLMCASVTALLSCRYTVILACFVVSSRITPLQVFVCELRMSCIRFSVASYTHDLFATYTRFVHE